MNGLSTRNALRALNDLAHQCDDAYAHPHARARIMGYGAHDDFTLPRRPFMPDFTASDTHPPSPIPHHRLSLGTPGEARRDREARLEATWAKTFAICAALAAALLALWWVNAPAANQPRAGDAGIQYRAKAARLAVGKSRFALDREGCLIGLHKDAAGLITHTVVATHC